MPFRSVLLFRISVAGGRWGGSAHLLGRLSDQVDEMLRALSQITGKGLDAFS